MEMEMEMETEEQTVSGTPSRYRTPLFENTNLDEELKGSAAFAIGNPPKRGSENAWPCTPTPASTSSTPAKASCRRPIRHGGTLSCTRKRVGSRNQLHFDKEAVSGTGVDIDPNPVSKSFACLPQSPCTSSSHYPKLSMSASGNCALENDRDRCRDENVQVIVRIRPFSIAEMTAHGTSTCLTQEGAHALTWLGQPESRFTFDHIACASTTQEQLFQVAGLPMVENCIKGYNSTIFAYGQTGSGKTHTMLGDIEGSDQQLSSDCGITPRIFEYLFTRVEKEESLHRQDCLTFTCKCSFLEIYNEQITDLLQPTSTNLQIHENLEKGIFVENLKEVRVKNLRDVTNLLLQGAASRRVAQTRMNQESSRSHSVFTCVIESQWTSDSLTSFRFGKLNLVDLAGSERQKASGAEGERLRESANINKSLSTLGFVIMILVDVAQGKQRHVPYRDSKLTFLLQDSLGGNSKMTIIATVSPAILCANETLSTLKFAQRAKFIQNKPVINEEISSDVKALQLQIQELKKELEQLQDQHGPSKAVPSALTQNTEASMSSNDAKRTEELHSQYAGAAAQQGNEVTAVDEQMISLLEAYERDLEYVKTLLQLKEDKIQRLKQVEDAVLSSDKYLQEENHALQRELLLLREHIKNHPELRRFAFENKQLIQQLRSQDEKHGNERNMLLQELASVHKQALQKNDQIKAKETIDKTILSERLTDEGTAIINEYGQTSNTLRTGMKSTTEQSDIYKILKEGAQALDDSIQQLESMPMHNFMDGEDQPKNLLQLRNIPNSDGKVESCLQQAFKSAKEIENQFKVLCDARIRENQPKRNEPFMKKELPDSGCKRKRKALQLNATDNQKQSGKELDQSKEEDHDESQSLLPKNMLSVKQNHECRVAIKPHRFHSTTRSTIFKENECLFIASKSQDGQNSVSFSNHISHKLQRKEPKLSFNERKRRNIALKAQSMAYITEAKAKHALRNHFIRCMNLALASIQDLLATERQKGSQTEWKKEGLEHLERRLQDLTHMFAYESQGFDTISTLTEKLQDQEKQWASQKINLKRRILKLQTAAVAREKLIAALQEELTTRVFYLSQQLECSEKQRLWVGQLYRQTLQETRDGQSYVKLQLQRLKDQLKEGRQKFTSVKKQMKTFLTSIVEETSKRSICTEEAIVNTNSLEYSLQLSYQWTSQMLKELRNVEAEMLDSLAKLETQLEICAGAWTGEKATILLELDNTKLDAEEKLGAASEALEKFKNSLLVIREAEVVVNTLTQAMDFTRNQKAILMNQWFEERERMMSEITRLRQLVPQKHKEVQKKEIQSQQLFLNSTIATGLAPLQSYLLAPGQEDRKQSNPLKKNDFSMTILPDFNCESHTAPVTNCEQLLVENIDSIPMAEDRGLDKLTSRSKKRGSNTHESVESCQDIGDHNADDQMQTDAIVENPIGLQRYNKGTSILLKKLEGIFATLSHKQGGEDAWVRFLNSFALALSKLEEDANSCLSFSTIIYETLDKTLAEKQHLQQELIRKQELLKGSFFDLSLLQESTVDYLSIKKKLDSLQAELDSKNKQLQKLTSDCTSLNTEKHENAGKALSLEAALLETRQHSVSLCNENTKMRLEIEKASEKFASLEAMLEEQRQANEKFGLQISKMNMLMEQRTTNAYGNLKKELGLAIVDKQQLKARVATLEEQLNTTKLVADTNKRLADEAQQMVEARTHCIQEKAAEVKNLERSIRQLESTVSALESQIEIFKSEAELQQLSREDLEMELQALKHQHCHGPLNLKHAEEQQTVDIIAMKTELAEKSLEIKHLTMQVKELMISAELQATHHRQKAMVDNFNHERERSNIAPRKITAGKRKNSTSPFKCISSGLAEQASSEIDQDLYLDKCRIDELQDLAASRQKEIIRLNKKLRDAEVMTYDVIRELLGVKSDITIHAELELSAKDASRQAKAAVEKAKELKALQDHHNEEKVRWFEENRRRQAEVIAAHFAMEKLRQKGVFLKAENKRLKLDLHKQKKRLLHVQEKMKVANPQKTHLHHAQTNS